ncbi:MAG: hypothetical protein AB7K63_03840 [Vicinamibacterales bacterium]
MTQTWLRTERGAARAFMFLNAIVLLLCGWVVLTEAVYIPVTVALWLGAAACVALGILTPLDEP